MSITSFLHTGGAGRRTGAGPAGPTRVRAALRAGTVAALTSAPLLVATSAMASNTYDGEDSGPGLTVLQTIGIFVCIPIGLFLLITFLVVAPGWIKGDRNRREVGWSGQAQPAGAGSAGSGSAAASGGSAGPKKAASSIKDAADKVTTGTGTGGASGTWQN